MPSLYGALGYSDHTAGLLVAAMMLSQTSVSFGMHVIMRALKLTTIKAALAFSGLAILGTLSLLLAKPVPWLAPLMIGIATGGLFPVALLQILDFARDRSEFPSDTTGRANPDGRLSNSRKGTARSGAHKTQMHASYRNQWHLYPCSLRVFSGTPSF